MAPTLARTIAPVQGTTTATLTTGSFSPAANELLVIVGQTEAGDRTFGTISNSGTALTWTSRIIATDSTTNNTVVQIWTAKVGASAPGSMTVSVTATGPGGNGNRVISGSGWTNATLAASPATHSLVGSTTCQDALSTVATGSVVVFGIADWNAVTGTATYRSSASQLANSQISGAVSCYAAYQSAPSIGSQTYGMTAPSGQKATMAAIEIQDATPASPPTVDAGADISGASVGGVVARRGVDADNGTAITARSWSIVSGPSNVGPAGANPGAVLNIGSGAGQNHFELQTAPVGAGSAVVQSMAALAAGYESNPDCVRNGDGSAVSLYARNDGPIIGGSTPRCELRECDITGANYTFDPFTNTHRLRGRSRITHVSPVNPAVVVAQLHNGTTDRVSIRTQLISGAIKLLFRVNGSSTGLPRFSENYVIGTEFEWMIEVIAGTLNVYYNDMVTPIYTSATGLVTTGSASWYFKCGCYNQSTTDDPTESCTVELRNLQHWHTGWATPNAFPTQSVVGQILSTDANLLWSPPAVGTYVLRYSATNAAGTTTADVTVVVGAPAGPDAITPMVWNVRPSTH